MLSLMMLGLPNPPFEIISINIDLDSKLNLKKVQLLRLRYKNF